MVGIVTGCSYDHVYTRAQAGAHRSVPPLAMTLSFSSPFPFFYHFKYAELTCFRRKYVNRYYFYIGPGSFDHPQQAQL